MLAGARMMRWYGCFLLLGACGSDRTTTGHWQGNAADASADVVDLSSKYPSGDPDPDGGTQSAPDFGGGDAGGPFRCMGKTGTTGDKTLTLTSNGLLRDTLLHVPSGYDPQSGAMLILNFHGYTSNAAEQVVITRMNKSSDKHDYIVAYPNGVANGWNAGDCCGTAWTNSVDDVKFTKDLLAMLESDWCIDPKRVYATGFSNGGFLSHRLACEMADMFAAIAPVSGVLGIDPTKCNPSRPVPVIDFHGTADPIVPYNGGTPIISIDLGGPVTFRSVSDTIQFWRMKDGCLASGKTIYQQGDATCTSYGTCNGGAEVVHCKLQDDGHTWAGGVPIPFLGNTSNDISADETMFNFFSAHPHP